MRANPPPGPAVWASIVLALFGVALAAAVGELSLRAYGFEFITVPTVQFGWPEPDEIASVFTPDRDLFWVTKDYATKLADLQRAHPDILFLGDSCTQFGTWPELTLANLAAREPSLAHGAKLAVAGWSSDQGRRQLRRDVLPLRPHVITIYYGWNDHWIAFGKPDEAAHPSALSFWLTEHVRLMQLIVKLRFPSRASEDVYRVPRDRYRANLEEMIRLARQAGIRPVLITAPSAHVRGHEPAYLARRHLRNLADLVPLHRSYVQATREAAAAAGGEVCDAAAKFETLPPPIRRYFSGDGIHLSDRGSRALADMVTDCLTTARPAGQQQTH